MDWAWCGAASRWQSSRSVGGVVYSEAVEQCADTSDTEHALLSSVSEGNCIDTAPVMTEGKCRKM